MTEQPHHFDLDAWLEKVHVVFQKWHQEGLTDDQCTLRFWGPECIKAWEQGPPPAPYRGKWRKD